MLKLLVVDDEAGIREGLALGLGDMFEVSQAADGSAALRAIAEGHPDLVILDQKMEGLSGTRVLEQIQALEPRVPVVMLSAVMDVALAKHSLNLGAQDCVAKPFSLESLRHTLNQVLSRRPQASDDDLPFVLQAAPIMAALDVSPGSLEEGRSGFILRLLSRALEDSEGDLDLAAERLGLEKEEVQRLWQGYTREGSQREGIATTR
jgi:DNA-binding response OmpR family regulator